MHRCLPSITRTPLLPSILHPLATIKFNRPLQQKLLASANLKDFHHTITNRPIKQSPVVLASLSTFFNRLLQQESRLPPEWIASIISLIEKTNPEDLPPQSKVGLMSILREVLLKEMGSGKIRRIHSQLLLSYCGSLKKIVHPTPKELSEIIKAFIASVGMHYDGRTRTLMEKVSAMLSQCQQQISIQQLSDVLQAINWKKGCSRSERSIRKQVLIILAKKSRLISGSDLMRIGKICGQRQLLDLSGDEEKAYGKLVQKVLECLPQMQIHQVLELVTEEGKVNKRQFNHDFFLQVLRAIGRMVAQDGSVSPMVSATNILRALSCLSNKGVTLDDLSENEQQKIMTFLVRYIKQSLKGERESTELDGVCFEMFHNRFIKQSRGKQLAQTLSKLSVSLSIKSLFAIQQAGISITSLVTHLLDQPSDQHSTLCKIKLCLLLQQLPKNTKTVRLLQQTQKELSDKLSTKNEFQKLCRHLYDSGELRNLQKFHSILEPILAELPNPFLESQLNLEDPYLYGYAKQMLYALPPDKSSLLFSRLPVQQSRQLLAQLVLGECRGEEGMPPFVLLELLWQQTVGGGKETSSYQRQLVKPAIDLLSSMCETVVRREMEEVSERRLFQIFHWCIEASRQFRMKKDEFCAKLQKYLAMNHNNYNVSLPYRTLLLHLLNRTDIWRENVQFAQTLLEQAARVNIATSKHLSNIDIPKYHLKPEIVELLKYSKDNSYQPSIQKINHTTLKIILNNPNLHHLLKSQEEEISLLFNSLSPRRLIQYLVLVHNNRSGCIVRTIVAILQAVTPRMEKSAHIDILGVIHSLNGLENIPSYSKFAQQLLDDLADNITSIHYQTHLRVVEWLKKLIGSKPQQYLHALINHYSCSQQYGYLLIKIAPLSYPFSPQDLLKIQSISQLTPIKGLELFLTAEEYFQPAARREIMGALSRKLSDLLEQNKQAYIPIHFYRYIKSKYLKQTQAFKVSDSQLRNVKFSTPARRPSLFKYLTEATGWEVITGSMYGHNPYYLVHKYIFRFEDPDRIACYNLSQMLGRIILEAVREEVEVYTLSNSFQPSNTSNLISNKCGLSREQADKFKALCLEKQALLRKEYHESQKRVVSEDTTLQSKAQ